jgi:hypothetical protein
MPPMVLMRFPPILQAATIPLLVVLQMSTTSI